MNKIMKLSISLITISLIIGLGIDSVNGQSKVGTTVAPFLTIGTGARGSALGHAYTAIATGGDALFWNPAGVVANGDNKVNMFMTSHQLFAGIQYNALGITFPITQFSALGFSVATVDYGRMGIVTEQNPTGTGITFSANDLMVGVSYSSPLTRNFFFGFTGKYIRQTIWDMVAQTAAMDFGFILQTEFLNGLRLAGSITNFGGKMQMDGVNTRIFYQINESIKESNKQIPASAETGNWNIPVTVKFGISAPIIKQKNIEWLVLTDAHQSNDNYTNADFGSEFKFKTKTTTVIVRGGYKDLGLKNVDNHVSYGAGLELNLMNLNFAVDASLVPYSDLGLVKLIDFRVSF